MSLKRCTSKNNKKAQSCLKCGGGLSGLKDDTVNTCVCCGQQHLVDFYSSGTLVLTVAERPELRRRHIEPKEESPVDEAAQADFNARLAAFKSKWAETEKEKAANE